MAPKNSSFIVESFPSSSSEEEDEVSSEEEDGAEAEEKTPSGGSSEDEDGDPTTQIEKNAPSKKPEAAADEESDSDDSGSETESDSDTPNPRPISTKPMEQTPQTAKSKSKPVPSPAKPSAKRAGEAEQGQKNSKRPKNNEDGAAVAEDDGKKKLFQRLWSEHDEIAVLNGMLQYREKTGTDPMVDTAGFHESIKKSLHVDVSKAQLVDKVRRLKKKYQNNQGKGRNGQDPYFAKSHEQNAFDLSKKIWGDNGVAVDSESTPKINGKAKRKVAQNVEDSEVKKDMGPRKAIFFSNVADYTHMEEKIFMCWNDVVGGVEKSELEKRWRKVQIRQLELYLERQALVVEQAKLVLEHLKSSDE